MDWKNTYKVKLKNSDEIVNMIDDGWVCFTDIATAAPTGILSAIGKASEKGRKKNLKWNTLLDLGRASWMDEKSGIRNTTWFSGGGARKAVNAGIADVMPCCYRDIPSLIDKYVDVDAFIVTVSPMDQFGYFSTGVTASNCEMLIKKAKHIIVEVNSAMPRVTSAPMIHISQVDALCEYYQELPIIPPAQIDEISGKIGQLIADEIPDGATIQLGIGAIPEAVGLALKEKKDLGIHTELLTDSMIELIECGAVTNKKKPIHTGKTVATFAFGSKRIYEYLNDNPSVELLPVNYVNNPEVIRQHPNFISVNGGLEVDFWGQVCAESIGTRHFSGTGGQADYVRGAIESEGGKSFIAFPSTAQGGAVSRIKSTLTPGAVVTTSKNDVDYIVTEYGVAKLRGKNLRERTEALIAIAHPKFRDGLRKEAIERHILAD